MCHICAGLAVVPERHCLWPVESGTEELSARLSGVCIAPCVCVCVCVPTNRMRNLV